MRVLLVGWAALLALAAPPAAQPAAVATDRRHVDALGSTRTVTDQSGTVLRLRLRAVRRARRRARRPPIAGSSPAHTDRETCLTRVKACMELNPNAERIEHAFLHFGLVGFRLERQTYCPDVFGDGEVVFADGTLTLRFLFDRGQEFVEVAAVPFLDRFYSVDDLALGFGWSKLRELIGRKTPAPLERTLEDLYVHMAELRFAFSPTHAADSHIRVQQAAAARREAVLAWLESPEAMPPE